MKRWQVAGLGVGLALLGCLAYSKTHQKPQPARLALDYGHPIRITALPLDQTKRDGPFRFAGALALTSPDTERMHGLSDLMVDPAGQLEAVTDNGDELRARVTLDTQGRLIGLQMVTLAPLLDEVGQPLSGPVHADAEGLTRLADGDRLVSFEHDHRIWRYPAHGGPPHAVDRPMVAMAPNQGMEGLASAPLAGPEAYWVGLELGGIYLCQIGKGCQLRPNLPAPPFGFRQTALSETADGQLIILRHAWLPFLGNRIDLVIIADPLTDPRIEGRLHLQPPDVIENFEGVASVLRQDGGLRLYLISDDNFSDQQRTLLVAYDWVRTRAP